MAGLVPAIHVFACCDAVKTWMPGTSPDMTSFTMMRIFYWLGFKPDSEGDPSTDYERSVSRLLPMLRDARVARSSA